MHVPTGYPWERALFHDRETAREKLTAKVEWERRLLADPRAFTTTSPHYIIADAEWRLRWLDCAPEGANHQLAPMQDKNGVPMGGVYNENLGPCQNLREAYAARGLHPICGGWYRVREAERNAATGS